VPATKIKTLLVVSALFLAMAVTGCGRQPEVEFISRSVSPDGKMEARLEFRVYPGRLGGDPAQAELRVAPAGTMEGSAGLVFVCDWPHASDYNVEWEGPTKLRVGYNPHATVTRRKEREGEVAISYFTW